MTRPAVEMADILRVRGDCFREQNRSWLGYQQLNVLRAISACRPASLGGHLDACSRCDHQAISYNPCRNRHCPKCQAQARQRWLASRRAELLAAPYAHVVFTLPHQLAPLAMQNKELIYGLLFRASAQTLIQIAADARHLGAEIGFFSVLHTWNQKLQHHPHVHCVVLPEVCHRITRGGLLPGTRSSFSRNRCSARSFVASSPTPWSDPLPQANSGSTGNSSLSLSHGCFGAFFVSYS